MDNYLIIISLFIFGAVFGSFLNVVIFRVPNRMSLIAPGSHCFSCKIPIKMRDNIPILGYFILNGKCRNCKEPYSKRYPAIEFLTAVVTCVLYNHYGLSKHFMVYTIVTYCLIAITFIDLDHMIIPNGFIILGFFCIPMIYHNDLLFQDWDDGAMGALIFGGFLFLIGVIGEFILRKESIGLGDVKLGLVLGAILGSKFSILALYLSFASAAISIMVLLAMNRIDTSNKIPFGPYISMGTFLTFMTSTKSGENSIINWYLSTLL